MPPFPTPSTNRPGLKCRQRTSSGRQTGLLSKPRFRYYSVNQKNLGNYKFGFFQLAAIFCQAKKLRMDMAGATPLATPQAQATPAQQDAAAPGDAQQQLKDRFVAKLNEPRGEKLPINRVDIK